MFCIIIIQFESESVSHSVVSNSATPWTVAHQALLLMEFSRQEYWSGQPHSLLQGIFLTQGLNLCLLHCRLILYHLTKFMHSYYSILWMKWVFPGGSDGKESAHNEENLGLIPGLGRSPGGGHGNSLQYSYLENPHGRRSLVGYSPWSYKESDTTEQLSTHG